MEKYKRAGRHIELYSIDYSEKLQEDLNLKECLDRLLEDYEVKVKYDEFQKKWEELKEKDEKFTKTIYQKFVVAFDLYYKEFQKSFSPEKLSAISPNEVTNVFMQIQDKISKFDNIMIVNRNNIDKINVDSNLRNLIVKGAKCITSAKLETAEDYDTLDEELLKTIGEYYQSPFIYKYYATMFPDVFSICYQPDMQFHLLYCFGVLPHEKLYVRGGQLAMVSNHACMVSPLCNAIALACFGNTKHFCKIDITNDQFDVFPMFKEKNIVSIGFKELGDLNRYSTNGQLNIDMLRDALTKTYYPNNPQQADLKAKEIACFYNANFDWVYVIFQNGYLVGLAESLGHYHFGNDDRFAHIKTVDWNIVKRVERKTVVDESPRLERNTRLPVNDEGVNNMCWHYHQPANKLFLYQKFFDVFHVEAASSSSMRIHPFNQILYGASGTGKTYSTTEMAMAIVENRPVDFTKVRTPKEQTIYRKKYDELVELFQISFITFHAGYTYQDFIQTLLPDMSLENGVLKRIADRASRSPNKSYVLIIDEINRANIASVFGEVISLIEPDKRRGEANEISATLPLGDNFSVPNNLYIIGTINSVDKTLPTIDPALRRRFDFIEVLPDENLVEDSVLKTVFINLNETLYKIYKNSDFLIGHAYFMRKKATDLVDIINSNVLPLLYEYLQGDQDKVKQVVDFSAGNYVSIVDSRFGRIKVTAKVQQSPQQQAQAQQQAYAQQQAQAQQQAYAQQQAHAQQQAQEQAQEHAQAQEPAETQEPAQTQEQPPYAQTQAEEPVQPVQEEQA